MSSSLYSSLHLTLFKHFFETCQKSSHDRLQWYLPKHNLATGEKKRLHLVTGWKTWTMWKWGKVSKLSMALVTNIRWSLRFDWQSRVGFVSESSFVLNTRTNHGNDDDDDKNLITLNFRYHVHKTFLDPWIEFVKIEFFLFLSPTGNFSLISKASFNSFDLIKFKRDPFIVASHRKLHDTIFIPLHIAQELYIGKPLFRESLKQRPFFISFHLALYPLVLWKLTLFSEGETVLCVIPLASTLPTL